MLLLKLVGSDAATTLWTKHFMEAQGHDIEKNILCQDNKSAILLEVNGRRSSGKHTRALSVCCFFLTDQVGKCNLMVECCPTDEMIGDHVTEAFARRQVCHVQERILWHFLPIWMRIKSFRCLTDF